MPEIARYRQVLQALTHDIESGKYAPGHKLPSEAALVAQFQTSRITVGRALRELKQQGLLAGRAGSGNYVSTPKASSAGFTFGLLIPNLGTTEIFEPICQGMTGVSEEGPHVFLWGHTETGNQEQERQPLNLCREFIRRRVDGVFFAPLEFLPNRDRVNHAICRELDAAQIPLVLLDRCTEPFPQRSKYDLVGIDNRKAGYLATEHLLAQGCEDVAFLALQDSAPSVMARMAGYREALLAGGTIPRAHRIQLVADSSPEHIRRGARTAKSTAFVCANDRMAGRLLQTMLQDGRRVPEDVRIVGIDDAGYATLLSVPLTTVRQPCRAIGEAAVLTMLSRRKHPALPARDVLLDAKLIVRQSSGVKAHEADLAGTLHSGN